MVRCRVESLATCSAARAICRATVEHLTAVSGLTDLGPAGSGAVGGDSLVRSRGGTSWRISPPLTRTNGWRSSPQLRPEHVPLLEDCGVAPGWRCAEVGAGSGSVAAWLADTVGPDGSVVAFDIDMSHLDHLADRSNVEVRHHDIVAEPIGEASFDLVHTRLVIEHLPAPERLLEMFAKAAQPGGLLVVECTDMLATAAADPSDPRSRAFDEFMAMSFAAVESMSTFDFGFARRLPQLFEALGFDASGSQVVGRMAGRRLQGAEYALPVVTMRSILIEEGTRQGKRSTNIWPASQIPISGSLRTTLSPRGARRPT